MGPEGRKLLDLLIGCFSAWDSQSDYYLNDLLPQMSASPELGFLQPNERPIAILLRQELSDYEWSHLADLVRRRRDEVAAKRAAELRERDERAEAERTRRLEEKQARAEEAKRQEARRRDEARRVQEKRDAETDRQRRKHHAVERLRGAFEQDFLSADLILGEATDAGLVTAQELDQLKAEFVQDWCALQLPWGLDREQALAVATSGRDVRVVARAGSGKTRVIVARAAFLIKHCRVATREMVLLAFNATAAKEMKKRLKEVLGDDLPHVMTFHALAHALVHPDEELIYDDSGSGQLVLSRQIQAVIDERIRSAEGRSEIRDLMLLSFREDWERIVAGGYQYTIKDYLAYRRSLTRESLGGEFVKSFGEKVIANALFENDVGYVYEKGFWWSGSRYRPDFTIPTGKAAGVIIEYFGLAGDPDYDAESALKRAYWDDRPGWTLIEFTPADLMQDGVDEFVDRLLGQLRSLGIVLRSRSEEEIWELIKDRATDRFTRAMQIFVSRARKRNLTVKDLRALAQEHTPVSQAEAMFVNVGIGIYGGYRDRLVAQSMEDFDGLIWRAVDNVARGTTRFRRDRGREQGDLARVRFLLIDEFQDFSEPFARLVNAIRAASGHTEVFCVGDDWQAINSFAGSDLTYFHDFEKSFVRPITRSIPTNYRSSASIVALGNAVMIGKGQPSLANIESLGRTQRIDFGEFEPSAVELDRHQNDEITPAVLRLTWMYLNEGTNVVVLTRTNRIPWPVPFAMADSLERFQGHLRSFLPEEDRPRLSVSTAHKYKGLETGAVIVLDAIERSYPLIHPNWQFTRIFGDSLAAIEAEERRLFYVAVTRAKASLTLVTERNRESPYLEELKGRTNLPLVTWADLVPPPSLTGARLEIRVEGFEVRDLLKNAGYHFSSAGRYWRRAVPSEGFVVDSLLAQPWAQSGVRISVLDESGQSIHRVTVS